MREVELKDLEYYLVENTVDSIRYSNNSDEIELIFKNGISLKINIHWENLNVELGRYVFKEIRAE